MRALRLALILTACLALGATPAAAKRGHGHTGAVYTETQDPAGNAVVVYKRAPNGGLTEQARVPTGGAGAQMTPPFNFPIVDSQGSVELTDNSRVLFAVNAGDDTISSFKVKGNGGLKLVDRKPSGGDLPVSIDSHHNLLCVVNSLSGDISCLRFKNSGKMTPIAGPPQPLSPAGGNSAPAQIGFSPRGRFLTVTLRGPQMIDTFKVGANGKPGPATPNPATDQSPFGFAYRSDGLAVVSNAGEPGMPDDQTKFLGRAATYQLNPNGALTPVDSIAVTGQRATCWVVITNNGRYAFMTNTLSQTVSRFRIARDGKLTLLGNEQTGPGFASDEALSQNSRYLYVLVPSIMGGQSHIDIYRVGSGGSLTHLGATPSNLPPGASGVAAR